MASLKERYTRLGGEGRASFIRDWGGYRRKLFWTRKGAYKYGENSLENS